VEHARLRAALARRNIRTGDRDLSLLWGTVCELTEMSVDPPALVVDLRDPPTGWSPVRNLIVALPGKWTTAWQCADQLVDTIT
jgi:hypothetical protein